jgi:hypothetical protein
MNSIPLDATGERIKRARELRSPRDARPARHMAA